MPDGTPPPADPGPATSAGPPADESLADRATRRAEQLFGLLTGPSTPGPGGSTGAGSPPGAGGSTGAGSSTAAGPTGTGGSPQPPAPADVLRAVQTAPSVLGGVVGPARILALVAFLGCVLVWMTTGFGEFWPIWVLFGFACAFGFDAAVARAWQEDDPVARGFALHLWLTVYTAAVIVGVWLLSGTGAFWPAWPLFTLGFLLLAHALTTPVDPFTRKRELAARVDQLTRTRSGVLDVQAAELRRIERDLHDGAQARLVALSMQLGRAEQRLGANGEGDPETLALIKGAQEEARQAIAELRDLARGIAPPLLVDRGLVAAVEALAQRSPLDVTVTSWTGIDRRLPTVVETAAYFVAAESLTNAAKHAGAAATVQVELAIDGPWLRLTVRDDGPGGADPTGSGLAGLRGRVEALDGRLTLTSPAGAGTTIVAELPCGS